jgi:hypothetical protein
MKDGLTYENHVQLSLLYPSMHVARSWLFFGHGTDFGVDWMEFANSMQNLTQKIFRRQRCELALRALALRRWILSVLIVPTPLALDSQH